MNNVYDVLKQHFDKLMYGNNRPSMGDEMIRQSFKIAYGTGTGLYDLVQTGFRIPTNYITGIATFIGEEPTDTPPIPTGILPVSDGIVYVNYMNQDHFCLTDETKPTHLSWVIDSMRDIVYEDFAFRDRVGLRGNYHAQVLQVLPLYMGFHHAAGPHNKNWVNGVLESEVSVLNDYIIRYLDTSNDELVLSNLFKSSSRYHITEEEIYGLLTKKESEDDDEITLF